MDSSSTVLSLQQRISEMQPARLDDRAIPTAPALRRLFPDGAIHGGSCYAVHGSSQLAIATLSAASSSGAWCGVLGLPGFGVEAATRLGIAPDRCILIPSPGDRALGMVHTLSEVLTVILLRASVARPGEAERISAKLREHRAALMVLGDWPRTESTLHVLGSRWSGLGAGRGMLGEREMTVRSLDRRGARTHTVRFDADGSLTDPASNSTAAFPSTDRRAAGRPFLVAVPPPKRGPS